MSQKLIAQFETYYKAYKDYNDYYLNLEKTTKENTVEQIQSLIKSPDEKKAMQFVIDTAAMPKIHAIDLNILKERVLIAFDFVQDLEEIPAEVKTELQELKSRQTKLMYIVKQGKAEEVNPQIIAAYKKEITPERVHAVMETLKNVKDLEKLGG